MVCMQLYSFAVNTTFVRMSYDLGSDQDMMKWVVAAYLIGVGTVMHPAGVISDSIGHHRTCRCGMVLFLMATHSVRLSGLRRT